MPVEPRTDLGPFSAADATARPWAHTVGALCRTQKFTICTVRDDGRPHATPLLAIWAKGGMCFVSGEKEQKSKNLSRNPKCLLTTGTNTLTGFDYVIEGAASVVSDAEVLDEIAIAYEQAYGWHLTREDGTWHGMGDAMRAQQVQTYFVAPTIIFAYGNGAPFSQTRYRFD